MKSDLNQYYTELADYMLNREQQIKQEIIAVALLWLVGCPILCLAIRKYESQDIETMSLYGKPDDAICGLYSYSVSSSMTGMYPKIWGSIFAPLFALLVVQRTSNGLCSQLKLGVMTRFSLPLSKTTTKKDTNEKTTTNNLILAAKVWKRIELIDHLGYQAAMFLIGLVAFDSRDFTLLHCILATAAFYALHYQNWLVGTLGIDFGNDLFPNWTLKRARFIFYLGIFHIAVMYIGFFVFGFMDGFNTCKDMLTMFETMSLKMFGNPTTMKWLASVAFWYNEYAFAFMCIYIQLLQHFELRLWDFAGEINMPYMAIVPRFSMRSALENIATGSSSDADVFLGVRKKD